MSQLSERCFQRSVLTNTVPDYSHRVEKKLMPSVNKKVFQLFCHKFFGKHTVKKKHHTCLPDTQNCDSSRGKKSWWKWIISKWIFESSCITPFGIFALSPFFFYTRDSFGSHLELCSCHLWREEMPAILLHSWIKKAFIRVSCTSSVSPKRWHW